MRKVYQSLSSLEVLHLIGISIRRTLSRSPLPCLSPTKETIVRDYATLTVCLSVCTVQTELY